MPKVSNLFTPRSRFHYYGLTILVICLSIFLIQPAHVSGSYEDAEEYSYRQNEEIEKTEESAFKYFVSDFLSTADTVRFLNDNRGKITVLDFESFTSKELIRVWYKRICSVRCN